MHYDNLKRSSEAPSCGQMLAYTRERVIFQPYVSLDEVRQILADKRLLELHLFDEDREYRAIVSRSPRFENGVIETVVDFLSDKVNEIYEDTVALQEKFGSAITVLNHIYYDEYGMAYIDNYRLRMRGTE